MPGCVELPHRIAAPSLTGWLLVQALLLSCAPSAPDPAQLRLEGSSTAIGSDGRLAEAVGLATAGGVFNPILAAGCALPCERTISFSTALDGQTELPLVVSRGNADLAVDNHTLGSFLITGILPAPRGKRLIEVTFRADADGISAAVRDAGGAAIGIRRLD